LLKRLVITYEVHSLNNPIGAVNYSAINLPWFSANEKGVYTLVGIIIFLNKFINNVDEYNVF